MKCRNAVRIDNERVSTGHLVLPRILSPASPRILLLPDVFLLSNKIRGDARELAKCSELGSGVS